MAKRTKRESVERTELEAQPVPSRPERKPLKPETRHGVLVVVLFALTALVVLSLANLAGGFGVTLRGLLEIFFGWARWAVPVALAVIGFVLVRPQRPPIRWSHGLGGSLLVLAVTALLHVGGTDIEAGVGGGLIGFLFWFPLDSLMGPIATLVVLIALVVIGILFLFETSLQRMFRGGQRAAEFVDQARDAIREAADRRDEAPAIFERRGVATEVSAPAAATGAPTPPKPRPPRPKRTGLMFSLDLLDRSGTKPTSANIDASKEKIRATLEHFGIPVEMGEVNVGPTVTQFTLKPSEGVKLAQITTLANDLALALAAHPIRIEAPIPGKSLVGVEVPNQKVGLVNLRDILDGDAFKQRRSALTFALGRDVAGTPLAADLDPMPHLLIAGATGSGKSVMINALLLSLLASNSPDELRFILVDPKRVELTTYNGIPHLLTPVITQTDKTINALRWVVAEMDRRFKLLEASGKRNIAAYHREVDDGMPYIVIVIDELADLMAVAANEVESAIIRLAQLARAVGIHLVLATQRPSVDVITGLIKANITARIAFTVASATDSRTILDHSGAEKLLGRGDMLFVNAELSKPKRVQGAFVSDGEIERVVASLKDSGNDPEYVEAIVDKPAPSLGSDLDDLQDQELVAQAKEVVLRFGKASTTFLQRRLRIGYARAARVMEILEAQGVVGPGDGAKPREILIARSTTQPFEDDEEATDGDVEEESTEDEAGPEPAEPTSHEAESDEVVEAPTEPEADPDDSETDRTA